MAGDGRNLSSKELSSIRSTVLEARDEIEDDIKRQLERYGVYEEERLDIDELSHLDMEDIEVRKRIDAAFEREMSATGDEERSYKNYVKEATFHHLNRLFALKVLEERGFITETLKKRPEYGNQSEMHRTLSEVAGELCEADDSGLSDALEMAYDELSEEIGVLFEDNDYTVIDLDFKVRSDVIELFESLDDKIWKADETIGWMYQYFGEREREDIDDRIDEENYKVQDTDIGVKTQLFTPRYIVEWMVDNSLGRLWLEMNPESSIDDEDKCFYLAPLEESLIDRDKKDVKDIKVLDPSCGSGHMLFYAFDVLYEMYLEEGDVPEKYIPKEILKNNLFGIDIDPYAVQLAALSLYVKAKSKEPDVPIEQINVVSADAVLVNGEKKREILRETNEIEKEVLEQVWDGFENIREYGSLVRIEKKIENIIEEKREKLEKAGQSQFDPDEGSLISQTAFMTEEGVKKSWDEVKDSILRKIKRIAREALEQNNPIEEMFAGELEKSVELVDIFLNEYDVVVTNPPYLASRKMGGSLKNFVKDNYIGSRDTFSAFIERCGEFTKKDGYFSMITLQGFMFLYSYRKLRSHLLNNYDLIEYIHSTTLKIGSDETVIHVTRNRENKRKTDSRFGRLVNAEDKITGLEEITRSNRENREHEDVYAVNQNTFKEIGRTPFVYWFGEEILQIFVEYPSIDDIADVKEGTSTGDDERFVRKWWELPINYDESKWIPFVMSGEDNIYFESIKNLVNWKNEGNEIKNYEGSVIRNEEYMFEEGLTFRGFSNYFVCRNLPKKSIRYSASRGIFPYDLSNKSYLLAYLNSSLVRYIMNGINPSVNFTVGDAKRIPVKKSNPQIESLVNLAIEKKKKEQALIESNSEFYSINEGDKYPKMESLLFKSLMLESDVQIIHGLIDKIIFDEYDISIASQKRIYEDLPKNLTVYPHIVNSGELKSDEKYEFRSEMPTQEFSDEEYDELVDKIEDIADKDLRGISEELEISPYTVAMAKHKHDLYTKDEKEEAAGRLLSYYLGCIMGRWDLEELEPVDDVIVVFDDVFEDNLLDLIRDCIEITYGEDEAFEKENEIEDMLRKDIEDWMRNKFFRYHHCKEYRRRGQRIPIYWHLESDEGAFSCFVYYHEMDRDTLPKVKGQYVDKKIGRVKNRLQTIDNQLEDDELSGSKKKELRSEREELRDDLDDLKDFASRLDELIKEGFEPDFEAGIWKNIQKVDDYDLLAVPLDKL